MKPPYPRTPCPFSPPRATINRIARTLGLSPVAVLAVFMRDPSVPMRPETREAVMAEYQRITGDQRR